MRQRPDHPLPSGVRLGGELFRGGQPNRRMFTPRQLHQDRETTRVVQAEQGAGGLQLDREDRVVEQGAELRNRLARTKPAEALGCRGTIQVVLIRQQRPQRRHGKLTSAAGQRLDDRPLAAGRRLELRDQQVDRPLIPEFRQRPRFAEAVGRCRFLERGGRCLIAVRAQCGQCVEARFRVRLLHCRFDQHRPGDSPQHVRLLDLAVVEPPLVGGQAASGASAREVGFDAEDECRRAVLIPAQFLSGDVCCPGGVPLREHRPASGDGCCFRGRRRRVLRGGHRTDDKREGE